MPEQTIFLRLRKIISFAAILAVILGGFFVGGNNRSALAMVGYGPGDMVINEFTVAGTQWVELFNTTGSDINLASGNWQIIVTPQGPGGSTTTLTTGIVPANGLLTISGISLPSGFNTLLTLTYSGVTIYSVSYGAAPFGAEPHVAEPGASQSAIMTGTSSPAWSVTSTVSKGWYNETVTYDCVNEPASPPSLSSIADCLPGITTNMANTSSIPDPTAATDLWFEKTGMGMIKFSTALNLTDNNTRNLLQSLGEKMDLAAGQIRLDASTAELMKNAGATIYFYNVFDGLGYDNAGGIGTDSIIVRDDSGNIIPTSSVDYPNIANDDWNTDNGGTFWFDTNHFSEYDLVPVLAEVTPVPSNTNTTTPDYTFSSNVAGIYVFQGDCAGTGSGSTTVGNNTITLAALAEGLHTDCAVKVIDGAGSSSTLSMSSFNVDVTPPSVTVLGDGTVDYSLPSTCPSVACNRGDIYGAQMNFSEELDAASKTAVENAITAGASVAPRAFAWSGSRLRIYATQEVTFANDVVVSSISDLAGNTSSDVKLIDSKNNYIQDLIDAAEPGATVTIPSGTYEENIEVNKPITLVGDPGSDGVGAGPDAPVIVNDPNVYTRTINISASGAVVKGFIVENNYNYPAVRVDADITSATVSSNDLRNAYIGVGLTPGSYGNTITKNKIYSNNEYGILIGGSTGNTISNNEIYSNSYDGIYAGAGGCGRSCTYTDGGNNINNNNIHENGGNGIEFGDDLDTSAGTINVVSNTIESNNAAGVYIGHGTSGISIQNNTISNNGLSVPTTGIHTLTAAGNSAHKNIISNDGEDIGVKNEDAADAFDASQNYWGDAVGPYEAVTNTDGNIHSSVSGNVTYSPWFGSEDMNSLRGIPTAGEGDTKVYVITEEFDGTNGDYDLIIPASTTVTGPTGWDGTINPPTVTTIDNPPAQSGYTTTMGTALEVGFSSAKLTLDHAAKLVFPGEAGKRIGYTRPGESFTEITAVCGENTQTWADANLAADGDCKIDSGSDLVVWTKHFTKFATYTMTANPSGGSAGGGTPLPVTISRPLAAAIPAVSETTAATTAPAEETVAVSNPSSNIEITNLQSALVLAGSKIKFDYKYTNTGDQKVRVKVVRQLLNAKGKVVKSASVYRTMKPGAYFINNVNEQVSGLLPAGQYTMLIRIYNAKNVKIDENSFKFTLQRKVFALGAVDSESSAIAFDRAALAKIKSGSYLPLTAKIKFSYVNNTDKYRVIKMVRELMSEKGKVLATRSGKWKMAAGESDAVTFSQAVAGNLGLGNYKIRIRAYDWSTKQVYAENAVNFAVELK